MRFIGFISENRKKIKTNHEKITNVAAFIDAHKGTMNASEHLKNQQSLSNEKQT